MSGTDGRGSRRRVVTTGTARHAIKRGGIRRGETAASAIYLELRRQIAWLDRKPGEPISEKEIAQYYGVSRTPVREALLRLADEGLVDIFPQSGTFVSLIPMDALPEAIVIRKALEEAAARYAAERATPIHLAEIRGNLDIQAAMNAAGDQRGFHTADEAFHELIAKAAGYPGFWTLAQQVKVQVDRYRLLTLPAPGRMGQVIEEHAAIADAIERRDPDAAAAKIGQHLDSLRIRISETREEAPAYFSHSAGPGG
ncbi:MAG TPA: GntR family transcriptional regulator [Arenibaculum sp.]|nr:GntR family transcriptional regulator [Arenibaculum sp.]